MKVGVIQSNYIPWRGYFDFIASVDLFIFYDDMQYSKGSWRNRNRIKTPTGLKWLTVPVKYLRMEKLIEETAIDYKEQWQKEHLNKFAASYSKAPYFNDALNLFEDAFSFHDQTISELNIRFIRQICTYLGITTQLKMSRDYSLIGSKTERLINLMEKTGATTYLSGPAAKSYLEEAAFERAGIGLSYKSYEYKPYPQLWGDFAGTVTVLDLIANCGRDSHHYIKSLTPDEHAIR